MTLRRTLTLVVAIPSAIALHAEDIFTETFGYGPGVPDREQIQAGESIKQNSIRTGDARWESSGSNNSQLVFAPGKGLTVSEGTGNTSNASIFISLDPELFSAGSPVRVELDILPGDSWSLSPSSVRGVWMGFTNTDVKELLPNINETGDHLVLRYDLSRDSSKSLIGVEWGVNGESRGIRDPKLPLQPGSIYRMALAYNPSDHSFEASITETESGETQLLSDVLAQTPNFNVLRVDFTAIDTSGDATLPLIKSISLKK